MKKLIFAIILILTASAFAQRGPVEKARGFFLAVAVGPRLPLGYFSNSTNLGYGFNVEFSYTDDEYLPVFLFCKVGFDQFPGAQQFYEVTDYSNYSTNAIPVNIGARYYFPPLVKNVVILMPMLEVSADYMYMEKLHQFKPATGRSNYLEDISKFGFSVGTGLSMFMMEILANYNYYYSNQFISLELKVRLPLYINY